MRKIILCIAFFTITSCGNQEQDTAVSSDGLAGPVFKVQTSIYEPWESSMFGEISRGERVDVSNFYKNHYSQFDEMPIENSIYKYTAAGDYLERVVYAPDGRIRQRVVYSYDNEDRRSVIETFNPDNHMTQQINYAYDNLGNTISTSTGALERVDTFQYNKRGKIIKAVYGATRSETAKINEYKYDRRNHLIEHITYQNDEPNSKNIISQELYEYDNNGHCKSKQSYNYTGALTGEIRYVYNANGYLIEENYHNSQGLVYCRIEYIRDNEGKVLEKSIISDEPTAKIKYTTSQTSFYGGKVTTTTRTVVDGKLSKVVERTRDIYNPDANQVERITTYENGKTQKRTRVFDKDNFCIKEVYSTGGWSTYSYNGNQKVETYYDENGYPSGETTTTYKDEIKSEKSGDDGELYDSDNLPIQQIDITSKFDAEDIGADYITYFIYDDNANLVEKRVCWYPDDGDSLISSTKYIYNANNVCVKEQEFSADGELEKEKNLSDIVLELKYHYTYEYDERGNWIKCVIYEKLKPKYIIEREITYYS